MFPPSPLWSATILKPKVLLDLVHQARPKLFAAPVHRQHSHSGPAAHQQMATMARFEAATVLGQPAFQLAARHKGILQHICCKHNKYVLNTTVLFCCAPPVRPETST